MRWWLNMCPKCPRCGENIDYLDNTESGHKIYKVYLSGNHIDYDDEGFEEDNNVNDFSCPECDEILFTSTDETLKFLKGETEEEVKDICDN